MFFTLEDYKKIYEWISRNSIRDTEFNEALTPLDETDTITLVLNGVNVRISLKDLVDLLFLMGVSDFLNITDKYREKNITLDLAIELIPYTARKVGQVITFLDTNNKWKIYLFRGELTQWDLLNLWEDILDIEAHTINSILPDEEDLTKSLPDANGNSYLSFKDRAYNPEDFSGLGRVILRKNIVEIEDPIYGKVKKNVLYQDMINKENTIYVIQYDFTLNENITVPANCVLEFDGGSIGGNNILSLNNTYLKGTENAVLCNITGDFNYDKINIFGVVPSNTAEQNSINIKRFSDSTSNSIIFGLGIYKFSEPIKMKAKTLVGVSRSDTILEFDNSDGIYVYGCALKETDYQWGILNAHTLSINNLYIKSKGHCIDLRPKDSESKMTGACFSQLNLESGEGAGIYSTNLKYTAGGVTHRELTYSNDFNNINFIGCKYCFLHTSLILNTMIEECLDFACEYYFYNCVFSRCIFKGGNVGWGHTMKNFIYNDLLAIASGVYKQSIYIESTNIEELLSNAIVNYYTSYNNISALEIHLKSVHFNFWRGVSEGEVYYVNSSHNIVKGTIEQAEDFYPIIGYAVYPIAIDKFNYIDFNINGHNNHLKVYAFSRVASKIDLQNVNLSTRYYDGGSDEVLPTIPVETSEVVSEVMNNTPLNTTEGVTYNKIQLVNELRFRTVDFNKDLSDNGSIYSLRNNKISNWIKLDGTRTLDINWHLSAKKYTFYVIENVSNNDITIRYNYNNAPATVIIPSQEKVLAIVGNGVDSTCLIPLGYPFVGMCPNSATWVRPTKVIKGQCVYDYNLNRPIWYKGEAKYVEYDGVAANTPRSGTFAEKPTTMYNNYVPIGFAYFCTDKQTTEGATNGIMIYHKGNNVWVDALGRVVE